MGASLLKDPAADWSASASTDPVDSVEKSASPTSGAPSYGS